MVSVENLHLRYAEEHVRHFEDQQGLLMRSHYDAMDCRNCEAFLQLGIDAFAWLVRADEIIRAGEFDGKEHDASAEASIETMFRGWLRPCQFAHAWIKLQTDRNYKLDNLEKFLECEREVRSIVAHLDADELSDDFRK